MPSNDAHRVSSDVLDAARASGLVVADEPLLVMLSGGADSVCLLDVAIRLGARVSCLHVNYGLREEADADEEHCRQLCASRKLPLEVERVPCQEEGNVQALARDARYALAERRASGDYAAAHTATDQAETVLYRLATSPGRRALLGMEARRGRLVRPLLKSRARRPARTASSVVSAGARTPQTRTDASRARAYDTMSCRLCVP